MNIQYKHFLQRTKMPIKLNKLIWATPHNIISLSLHQHCRQNKRWVALYFTVCALNNEKVLVNIRKLRIAFFNNIGSRQFLVPVDIHCIFPKMEVDGNRQNILFWVRQKKETIKYVHGEQDCKIKRNQNVSFVLIAWRFFRLFNNQTINLN